MNARMNLVGLKQGRLTVVAFAETRNARAYWQCICECGAETIVATTNLRENSRRPVRSCGCLRVDVAERMGRSTRTHGEAIAGTVEYRTWRNIRIRCQNENAPNWKWYGAMGVKVCDRWDESYEMFLADMGRRPSADHSIDRYPDPYGDYEPGNCRWATPTQQRHNRRT